MQNRNYMSLAVGIVMFALVAAGVFWPKSARDEQSPKPAIVESGTGGSIVLPEAITQFAADGPDGLVSVELDKGIGQLPVGAYSVGVWQAERNDDQDTPWTLTGRLYGSESPFEITDGGRTNVDVGEPIVAEVNGSQIGPKYYSFSQSLQGRLDEQITLSRNGARPGAPKLRIKNKDGTYDRTFAFQYG
ncbi:hypothetical protein ACFL5Z_12215 [Planctomycetota bacterium]